MLAKRPPTGWIPTLILLALLAGCAPQTGLPSGPTAIPTLAPVTEAVSAIEPTATPSFSIRSYPVQPPSATEGEDLYQTYCTECHGDDGTGVVPGARNFRDLDYMRGETPADFYAAVTEGRGSMPDYRDTLSSDERWDVVFYVWQLSTKEEFVERGEEIYQENCASCHGENGSGELLGSADFTDLREMDELAPRDLYLVTTQGRGSMPAWQSLLSQDDRWAVIDYIRTFTYEPSFPEGEQAAVAPTEEPTQPAACDAGQENPISWDDSQAIAGGMDLYQDQCAMCHGPEAAGGVPDTPDFTSSEVSLDLHDNPGQYFCVLTQGEGSMPAYAESLSEEARWQLITYLGSLGP